MHAGQSIINITSLTLWHLPLTSYIAYNMSDGKICNTVKGCILRLEATRVGCTVADLVIMLEQLCVTLEECAGVRDATGLVSRLKRMVMTPPR